MIYRCDDDADLAAATVVAGDTITLACGATFSASAMPASISTAANLTIGYHGNGAKPVLTGGATRSDWVYDAENDVYSRTAYASNKLGNVTEDGVPMRFTAWDTDIATTAAAMTAGQSLPYWSGSMTYDPVSFIVYIRPSSGLASEHEYVVSEVLWGIYVSNTVSGLLVDGLHLTSLSRHGLTAFNRRQLVISDTDFSVMGGLRSSGLYMGNGIEISKGCDGARVYRCRYYDIFDSGATTQLYEVSKSSLQDHAYVDNECYRYGLTAIEVSCQTANQFISDVEIAGLVAEHGQQNSWSTDRGIGGVVSFLCNGNSVVTRGFARDVTGNDQRRSYIGYQHQGICGIEDSTFVGTYLGPIASQGSNGAQTDLRRSCTMDGTLTGTFVAAGANLRDSFRGAGL